MFDIETVDSENLAAIWRLNLPVDMHTCAKFGASTCPGIWSYSKTVKFKMHGLKNLGEGHFVKRHMLVNCKLRAPKVMVLIITVW